MKRKPSIFLSTLLIVVYGLFIGIPLLHIEVQAKLYPCEVVNVHITFCNNGKVKKEIVSGKKNSDKKVRLHNKKRFLPETVWCLTVANVRQILFYDDHSNPAAIHDHVYITLVVTDPLRGPPAFS